MQSPVQAMKAELAKQHIDSAKDILTEVKVVNAFKKSFKDKQDNAFFGDEDSLHNGKDGERYLAY